MMGLGTFFYLVDIKNLRWPFIPLKAYGMNAITAFVLAGVLGRIMGLIRWRPDPDQPDNLITLRTWLANQCGQLATHLHFGDPAKNASLAYALCFVLAFGILMFLLYKFRIFLKV
jgi:predicted acyltransferase